MCGLPTRKSFAVELLAVWTGESRRLRRICDRRCRRRPYPGSARPPLVHRAADIPDPKNRHRPVWRRRRKVLWSGVRRWRCSKRRTRRAFADFRYRRLRRPLSETARQSSRLAGRRRGAESSTTSSRSGSRVWAAMDASERSASRRGRSRVATTAAIGGIVASRLSPVFGCGRALKRSEPAGIRTQDTRIKSPVLWPTELPAHQNESPDAG